ncbi:MAG: C25 family cysteine peptidase, partial [Candidatus Hodarchaeales archaeon]
CGNGKCGIGEDCETCEEDCPPGDDTCESIFDGVCCPEGANEDYGCISGEENLNLTEGEFCYCSNQCNETLRCTANHCCPPGKFWDGTECSDKFDVLIVALKSNLKEVYSESQIQQLEDKIDEYITSLNNDGLGGYFVYLDGDEIYDNFGYRVNNPSDWSDIDGILDQLIPTIQSKYLLIVGGHWRFPRRRINTASAYYGFFYTDDPYGDYIKPPNDVDALVDIPVGRIPDPQYGDINLLLKAFDTFIKLHNEGGIDISYHVGNGMPGGIEELEGFSYANWGQRCNPYPDCFYGNDPSRVRGRDFFYVLCHGGPTGWSGGCTAVRASTVPGLNVEDAMWLAGPCFGGYIRLPSTSNSVVMTFLKEGGAVFIGSDEVNYCAIPGPPCKCTDGGCYVGSLYSRIVKRMSKSARIGDAYLEGKRDYDINCPDPIGHGWYQTRTNHLYSDPTIKIKNRWS